MALWREAWKEEALTNLPGKDERDVVSQTNTETVSKATLGTFLREGVERRQAYELFRSYRYLL